MKVLVLCLLVLGVALADEKSVAQQLADILNSLPLESYIDHIPEDLRQAITKRQAGQHWCCPDAGGHLTPVGQHESRITVMYKKVSTEVTNDFHGCGLWGMGRCEMTNAKYHQIVEYGERYLHRPVFSDCHTEVVCCDGHLNINNNCISHAHVAEHGDSITILTKLGLIKQEFTPAPEE